MSAASARVEQIVADLRGIEGARIDDAVEIPSRAEPGDAEEADLALLAQALERRHHLAQHDLGGERPLPSVRRDPVVQLQEVDLVAAEPLQARLERRRHRRADLAVILG